MVEMVLLYHLVLICLFSSMYDVDGNGWIDLPEMTKIVRSIYRMTGPRCGGGESYETPEVRAASIFKRMDVNSDGKVTRQEFVTTCLDDQQLIGLLTPNVRWCHFPTSLSAKLINHLLRSVCSINFDPVWPIYRSKMPLGDVVVVKFPPQLLSLSDTNLLYKPTIFTCYSTVGNIFINYSDQRLESMQIFMHGCACKLFLEAIYCFWSDILGSERFGWQFGSVCIRLG